MPDLVTLCKYTCTYVTETTAFPVKGKSFTSGAAVDGAEEIRSKYPASNWQGLFLLNSSCDG